MMAQIYIKSLTYQNFSEKRLDFLKIIVIEDNFCIFASTI